jgi:serine/threonine protein kinase
VSGETGRGARWSSPTWPNPGALLGRGRYRLLAEVGRDDRCAARLWQGRDLVLERDVALTLFIAGAYDRAAETAMSSAVQRALRSARLEADGAARVLDVLEPDSSSGNTVAAVVAEWTPGRDLVDIVKNGLPSPSVAASMLAPLAGAVDAAHRSGLVLGCDHPHRIRVTPDGLARLAFPGPPPETGPADDVRGLGAALYLLLTGYWPLPGGPSSLPSAKTTEPDGTPVNPRTLRSEVPTDLATLALRSLGGAAPGGVHTGAAVQRMLEFNTVAADDPDILPTGNGAARLNPADPEQELRERQRKLHLSVAVLVTAAVLILGYAGVQLASVFNENPSSPALIVGGPSPAAPAGQPAPPPPPPAGPIPVASLTVYDISGQGTPDNADQVGRLVDGNPSTGWSTDSYFQQFPAFKKGLGVMLAFAQPVAASSVTIDSPSPGTVLEVRSAPSPNAPLSQTTVLGSATLADGTTQIPLRAAPPTRYLLLWITGLSGGGDHNKSELSEVDVQRRAT